MSAAITLDELETLRPEDDIPGDARCIVTADELRAFCELIAPARELVAVFGDYKAPAEDRVHAG